MGVAKIQYSKEEVLALSELAATSTLEDYKRPKLLWVNLALTVTLIVCLVTSVLPLSTLFMIAFVVALMINYPNLDDQKERISHHAGNVLAVVGLVFASGIFTGILSGTEMVDAMANSLVAIIPESAGSYFAVITAVTSIPFTYFMANDPYYFGVLPILAETAAVLWCEFSRDCACVFTRSTSSCDEPINGFCLLTCWYGWCGIWRPSKVYY